MAAKKAPEERDDVVSGFTRLKIRDWQKELDGNGKPKRQLQELARIAGIAKSSPSQVKRGTGVGGKTLSGYAKAFGYGSVEAYRAAAWEWWKSEGNLAATVDRPHTPEQAAAVEAVMSLRQGTTEQIETILGAYAHERFRDRDAAWWTQTLLAELARDTATFARDATDRALINATHRGMQAGQEALKPKRPAVAKRKTG